MLDAPDGGTVDLRPVDAVIEGLVDETHDADVVAADDVEP